MQPEHLIEHWFNHARQDSVGMVANAWLVWADKVGPACRECEQLAQLHSIAVDFPKTGACVYAYPVTVACAL